jgi:hypothetical protein
LRQPISHSCLGTRPQSHRDPTRHHDSARGNRGFKSSRPDQFCETRSSRTLAVRLSCCWARSPVQPSANRDRRQWAPQRLLDPWDHRSRD